MGRRSPRKLGIDEPAEFVPERRMPEGLRDAEAEAMVEEDWALASTRTRRLRGRADRSILNEAGWLPKTDDKDEVTGPQGRQREG